MAPNDFPSLEPAFTARLYPSPDFQIGSTGNGQVLSVVPIKSGTIKSEPGFETSLDAEMVFGADYVRMVPDQSHVTINVSAILKNIDGALLTYSYKGIIGVNEEFMAVFTGSPDAKTTSYGNAISHVKFEASGDDLRGLNTGLFIGSAHFVVENGSFFIETKISKIVHKQV
ncbi:hypothetical protein FALBO_7199 [Fusarium albosuccineum]|uniref:Uncharacterized protein n=1 Tax=Fusarium albosuccineum TaxID=1237068 RepID=A0A8H4LE14_9HYPO|nr:hypothetical protein FALBO_7199 [Fusarium albosuccineum]